MLALDGFIHASDPEPETFGAIEESEKGFPWLGVVGGGVASAGIGVLVGKKQNTSYYKKCRL